MNSRSSVFLKTALFAFACALALMFGASPAFAEPTASGVTIDAPEQSASSPAVEPGVYYIQSAVGGRFMLDISGASKRDGANAQIYASNATNAQKWRVSRNADGTYRLQCLASGKYLDLRGATVRNSQNIWQYTGNGTKAQDWVLTREGTTITIASSINKNYVVDVSGARAKNSTNVQLYQGNGTNAQRWWFIPVNPAITSEKTIEDGMYEIAFTKNPKFVVDLAGASSKNGANIQIYESNKTAAQRWAITRASDGFYTVRNMASGKLLDVSGASPAARANVWSYESNNTDAQRWAIVKNSNGTYTFINKISGNVLDVAGGAAANGTNLHTFIATHGANQQFTIKELPAAEPGVYTIASALSSSYVMDVKNASTTAGTTMQLYKANDSLAQKFQLRRVGENTFQIQSVVSGLYLQDNGGSVTQQPRNSESDAQKWVARYEGNGVAFTNVATGKRLAVSGGKATNGSALVTANASNTNAQHFTLTSTLLIPNGVYFVKNSNKKVLDVASASFANQANILVYDANNSAAQKFEISSAGSGYYRMINDNSGKAVDVSGASKADGANVWQYTDNRTAAQQWKAELGIDGGFMFINKGSGKALDVQGSNVVQNAKSGASSQLWYLTATKSDSISGNAELDRYIKQVVNENGRDLRKCFNWVVRNISWTNSVAGENLSYGIISKQRTIDYALYAFRNHKGDCYYHASIFKWLARGCGYSAEARAGGVPSASRGIASHGWTEVYLNGTTYICDPNLALDIPGYNWYMVTYGGAPVDYYR